MNQKVTDFQVVDHGIDNSQYFQGCGTAFTQFSGVAIGIGDNPREAFENALEDIAQMGYDVDSTTESAMCQEMANVDSVEKLPLEPAVYPGEEEEEEDSLCELYYYVSIRFNVEDQVEPTEDQVMDDVNGREDDVAQHST